MSYNKLMTSDTNNVLTFKRKLLNMTVITNKHYFLLEELGRCGTKCDLKATTRTPLLNHHHLRYTVYMSFSCTKVFTPLGI